MSQYTVEQFASELNLPVDLLLDQLKNAGVKKSDSKDELSEEDKSALLNFLKQSHGDSQKPKNKITLTRKQNSEIQKTDRSGKSRTIQVEVRKKRTLIKTPEIKKTDSTGRSRTIQVEVRKKRTLIKTPEEQKTETEVIAPKVILDDEQQKTIRNIISEEFKIEGVLKADPTSLFNVGASYRTPTAEQIKRSTGRDVTGGGLEEAKKIIEKTKKEGPTEKQKEASERVKKALEGSKSTEEILKPSRKERDRRESAAERIARDTSAARERSKKAEKKYGKATGGRATGGLVSRPKKK